MSVSGNTLWSHYWSNFRFSVHQLLEWGYLDLKSTTMGRMEEEEITGCLVAAMQARLADPYAPDWTSHFSVKEDPPVHGSGRTGKRRQRTDIVIESAMPRVGRPHFVFEAKNLRGTKYYTARRYLGEHGLRRFLRGDYAAAYPEAGMLGYVQSDTVEHWKGKVQAALEKDATGLQELRLRGAIQAQVIRGGLPHEWVSEHDRHTGSPVLIYHVLLWCG